MIGLVTQQAGRPRSLLMMGTGHHDACRARLFLNNASVTGGNADKSDTNPMGYFVHR